MDQVRAKEAFAKVPAVTLGFWIIMFLATTLGETGADLFTQQFAMPPRSEAFYWLAITFSQTLGTALGDWSADDGGLGYLGGTAIFGGALAGLAVLYWCTGVSRVALFWGAFILTRPLGATLGDFLDKPLAQGGLDLGRDLATAVLLAAISLALFLVPQRSAVARH